MLSLRHQIEGNPLRIDGTVCNHKNFGGTGNHIDAYLAEDLPLCLCHKPVTWPHNFIDGLNTLSAIRQRGHCLGATYGHNLINTRHRGRSHHQWI